MKDGGRNFTLILTDPLAFSFLQNPHLPNDDPNTTREFRKRTSEEDEMLGLDTMKV